MSRYHFWLAPYFQKQLRKLIKKYPHLKEDIFLCLENFEPRFGVALGKHTYKVRLKSRDIPKGKNKAFRLIILVLEMDQLILPITIYFKGDTENMRSHELNYFLQIINRELQEFLKTNP